MLRGGKKRPCPSRRKKGEPEEVYTSNTLRKLAKHKRQSDNFENKNTPEKKVTESVNNWSTMPLRYKIEMVMEWQLNGGVFKGKRYFKHEFAVLLGITDTDIDKHLVAIKDGFAKQYENKAAIQKTVADLVNNVGLYLKSDRSRVILHADLFDNEIEYLLKRREELNALPESTVKEVEYKTTALKFWHHDFSWATTQRVEAIKLLFDSTAAFNRYLEHFSGVRSERPGDKPKPTLMGVQEEDAPQEDYVTPAKAIELLDARGSVLPTQAVEDINEGPRNPDDSFEGFEEPDK